MPTPRWHQPCRRILADATPCENHAAVDSTYPIERMKEALIHAAGIDSPGLTSCLSIGARVAALARSVLS